MIARTLEKWVDQRQMNGRYTFLRREANDESGLSREATKKALQRLVGRGRIAKVKNYFYVVVPLEYVNAKSPPASWFIDDLMAALKLPYYVGLLSAAAQHGASHHAPQEFQVITNRYMRPITVGRTRIHFFTSKFAGTAATQATKTPTGLMRISTVETTVFDLVRFSKSVGQIDHVASIINELKKLIDADRLIRAVRIVNDVPNSQRLGYVLQQVGAVAVAKQLRRWVENQDPNNVSLRPGNPKSNLPIEGPWHVLVDQPLEIEI
jgi:predicted transcriptional regulator of viral defense system